MDNTSSEIKEVYALIASTLEKLKMEYVKKEDEFSYLTSVKGNLMIPLHIIVSEQTGVIGFSAYAPFGVPDERKVHIALAVAKANMKALDGCFEYNAADGSLLFYSTAYFKGCAVESGLVQYKILSVCSAMNRLAAAFKKICDEDMSEQSAVKLVDQVK